MVSRTGSFLASVAAVLALAGCTFGSPTATVPSGSPSASASPSANPSRIASPTVSPSPAHIIPTDCKTLVDTTTYAATFKGTPLNDPGVTGTPGSQYFTPTGVVDPIASTAATTPEEVVSNATQLRCIWRYPEADITNLYVEIGTVDKTIAASYFATLPAQKYVCSDFEGGRVCRHSEQLTEYPVTRSSTEFVRDDVHILVDQINFPTNNLLGAIVKTVWG